MRNKKILIHGLGDYAEVVTSIIKRENKCETVELTNNNSEFQKERNNERRYEQQV